MSRPKVIKFRNYVPRNEELKKQAVESKPTPSVELSKELDVSSGPSSDASKVGGQSTGNFVASGGDQGDLGSFVGILSAPTTIDPVSIAPKKANWDLKRDVEKRLAKLERQTQTAIRELIRTHAIAMTL